MRLPTAQDEATRADKATLALESPLPISTYRRNRMRHVLAFILSPIAAFGALALATTYSSPSEFWASIQPVDTTLKMVNAGGQREETVVSNIASSVPTAADLPKRNNDCFQDLALADSAKLDRCAKVVYQALIDVERETKRDVVRETLDAADRTRTVAQLKYAAAEVCRTTWAKRDRARPIRDSPACEVAEIKVALEGP